MTFGEKLSKLRKENNFTQEQLADILGVSRQSVSKWESDTAYPETEKLIVLGKLFDCSMDYLLREEFTERSVAQSFNLTEKAEEIGRKNTTEKNKSKAKRILRIIEIVMAGFLTVDTVAMVLYFLIAGTPQ